MIDPETGEVIAAALPKGNASGVAGGNAQIAHLSQSGRARENGISRRQQQKLDALAKAGRRDLLALISAGRLDLADLLRSWLLRSLDVRAQCLRD
jgi:hypothetical protein